jgi:ABC-type sugar transport system permease subunit
VELVIGLALALGLQRAVRGRGLLRAGALLPWAIPTVVAALIWRFMFENPQAAWFADARWAWVPILLADIWKATPFVALLLLAGLQTIDPALYEAAALDGATPRRQFLRVTLPLLKPSLAAAVVFRGLDAFRVFDVIYVLTAGGPGTATEPISLYAFNALFRELRFGFGSALSMIVFLVSLGLAGLWIRLAGSTREDPA